MTPYLSIMDPETGLIGSDPTLGTELNSMYATAEPFPHIAIENFLPEHVVERVLFEWPQNQGKDNFDDRAQERMKRQIIPENSSCSWLTQLFYSFNSLPFLTLIQNITGIRGLIPDPYFLGGGFHEIGNGGYLSMHADFNHHPKLNLERRINVLIYLNPGWTEANGGQLELWDSAMKKCVKSYVPVMNRAVIFNTTSQSMHGNPNPVFHTTMPRRSIALYYYTATWNDTKRSHTTLFKQRPGSNDKRDFKLGTLQVMKDWMPPVLFRKLAKWML